MLDFLVSLYLPLGVTYENALHALGDPTRRAIVAALRGGPQSVGRLGQRLPVSRPAVSQHLKVLMQAGLVEAEPQGNKRFYRLSPGGIDALRQALDALWEDALGGLSQVADQMKKGEDMIEPIVKNLILPITAAQAFDLYTGQMLRWWPVATHSLSANSGNTPIDLTVEPRVGGRVMETLFDGSTAPWGTITHWHPGRLFAMTWHVGRPEDEASHIRVEFEDTATGCKLCLIHDNWAALGDAGASLRENYHTGWDGVLAAYAAAA